MLFTEFPAVGALGGVGINLTLRQSYASSGTETPAFWIFLSAYFVAATLTWVMYVRPPSTALATPESDELSGSDEPDMVMSQLVQRDER